MRESFDENKFLCTCNHLLGIMGNTVWYKGLVIKKLAFDKLFIRNALSEKVDV